MRITWAVAALLTLSGPTWADEPHVLSIDVVGHAPQIPLAGAPAPGRRTIVATQVAADLVAAMKAGGGVELGHAKVELAGNETTVPFRRTRIRSYLGPGASPGETAPATMQTGLTVTLSADRKAHTFSYVWRDVELTGPERGFRTVERDGTRYQEPVTTTEGGGGTDALPLDGVIVQRSGDVVAFVRWD